MANEAGNDKRVDQPTGTEFVGHEWDGIEELNTPLPRWWLWTFYACIAWAIGYTILYPAWPMLNQATEGVLGWTSRGDLAKQVGAADLARADVNEQIARTPIERLPEDSALMQKAVAGGAAAFKVNCVQCHGAGAAGSVGYPNLNDDDWLWGGDLKAIEYTLTHGIRWTEAEETRTSMMPGFDGIFEPAQVDALVGHVLSFTDRGQSSETGAQLFADNCVACHQADGSGDRAQGTPALNDAIWLYGSDPVDIRSQILRPKHGVMPAWKDRLDPVTIKMLAAYVHSRGGGEDIVEVAQDPAVEVDEQP